MTKSQSSHAYPVKASEQVNANGIMKGFRSRISGIKPEIKSCQSYHEPYEIVYPFVKS